MAECIRCAREADRKIRMCEKCIEDMSGFVDNSPWSDWEEGEVDRSDPKVAFAFRTEAVLLNSKYQVAIRAKETPSGRMIHLSIKRHDKMPIRDWRDLQRIKNELVGEEAEAMELFPKESNMVDTSNQYHMWVFPDATFPFAFDEGRLVTESVNEGSVQRPWPLLAKPSDLKPRNEVIARIVDTVEKEAKKRAENSDS